jgi:hypothetical protein
MATADVDHGIEPCYFPGSFALSGAAREFPLALSGGGRSNEGSPGFLNPFSPVVRSLPVSSPPGLLAI